MSLIRFTVSGLERRCRCRGVSVESVEAAVVSRDGDAIMLDDQHEAYRAIALGKGLGDLLSVVPRSLGLSSCGGCEQIREGLNSIGRRVGL